MGDDRFYLQRSGVTYGPYRAEQLSEFAAQRRAGGTDLVRRDGETEWKAWDRVAAELAIVTPPPTLGSAGQAAPPVAPPTTNTHIAPTARLPERNVPLEMFLPVNRNLWAILAPYAGLFSLCTVGLISPFAILLGIVAYRTTPAGMPGRGRAIVALVLGGLGLIVLCVFVASWLLR